MILPLLIVLVYLNSFSQSADSFLSMQVHANVNKDMRGVWWMSASDGERFTIFSVKGSGSASNHTIKGTINLHLKLLVFHLHVLYCPTKINILTFECCFFSEQLKYLIGQSKTCANLQGRPLFKQLSTQCRKWKIWLLAEKKKILFNLSSSSKKIPSTRCQLRFRLLYLQ